MHAKQFLQKKYFARMNGLILPIIISTIFLAGCCVRFNDLSPGNSYPVGAVISTSNTSILVEQFQWANGNWTSAGEARVDSTNHAQGNGLNLNARNVNLNFQFNYPLSEITLKFAELGGNINVRVNNDFKNVQDLIDQNGSAIGGVNVTVTAVQQGNNWYGQLSLNGAINDFAIGGQELWLDDVCKEK